MKNDGRNRSSQVFKKRRGRRRCRTTVSLPRASEAQAGPRRRARVHPHPATHLRVSQSRRGGFRRGAGRPHGAGDQYTPGATELRPQHLHRSRARRRLGKGDRLYMQGPWKQGVPSQGYSSRSPPPSLYRTGIGAANAFCVKTYGRASTRSPESQREEFS